MAERTTYRPVSLAELADVVAAAAAEGRPLEVIGNGTKRGLGRAVEAAHRLELSGLRGISMYEPEELVMTAGAGTPLGQVEAELAEREQELAFDPADYGAVLGAGPGGQTIGGVFACNLAGPRRLKAGAARDHLLGLRCVTGRGEAIKTGGRVVKNVTGYDLCKLLTGSYGTLAALAEVTFKVMPRAEAEATLLVSGVAEGELLATLRRAMAGPYDVASAACLPPLAAGRSEVPAVRASGRRAVAALRLEGHAPSVAYRLGRLEAELGGGLEIHRLDTAESRALWREVRDLTLIPPKRALWRVSLAPSAASEIAGWAAEFAQERLWDWSGGLLWLAPREAWADAADTVRAALAGRGGHAMLVRAGEETRRQVPVFEPQAPALAALTRRVKASFDPKGILNPGRMYAGL
jgi:glycolate oxidase FAD binding subunit